MGRWFPGRVWFSENLNPVIDLFFEFVLVDEAVDLHGAEDVADAVLTTNRKAPMIQASEDVMKLKIVLQASDEGGFTVYVPSLPGCVSEGDTEQQALDNIREAIELYLEPVEDDLAGSGNEVREIVL